MKLIDFDEFDGIVDSIVKDVEGQRIADAKLKKKAAQLAMEKKRLARVREDARRDQHIREENARIDQERWEGAAAEERYQKKKKARLEDDEAKKHANDALSSFKWKKVTLINNLDGIKNSAVDAAKRDPRNLDHYFKEMEEMGSPVTTISDMRRILENKSLNVLVHEVIDEQEMSTKALNYFLDWVAPLLYPRPIKEADTIRDNNFAERRSEAVFNDAIVSGVNNMFLGGAYVPPVWGQGNQASTFVLPSKTMTENVPGLQQPGQGFMMASQPQVAQLQVNQYNTRRDPDYGKKVADAEHKQLIDRILKSVDIPGIVRAHNTSNHA